MPPKKEPACPAEYTLARSGKFCSHLVCCKSHHEVTTTEATTIPPTPPSSNCPVLFGIGRSTEKWWALSLENEKSEILF